MDEFGLGGRDERLEAEGAACPWGNYSDTSRSTLRKKKTLERIDGPRFRGINMKWSEIPSDTTDLPKKTIKRVLRTSLLNILEKMMTIFKSLW